MTDKKPVPKFATEQELIKGFSYLNRRIDQISKNAVGKPEVVYTPMTCYKCELIYFVKASNDECTDCHSGEAFRNHMDWHDEQLANGDRFRSRIAKQEFWHGFALAVASTALVLILGHLVWTFCH